MAFTAREEVRGNVVEAVRHAVDDGTGPLEEETLLEDLGVDSISSFEIRLIIRERLGVEVSEEEFAALDDVGSLVDQVLRSQS